MLNQVLHAIENAHGTINLADLSRKLGIERSALEGMITFWVRKGRLRDDDADLAAAGAAMPTCASASCSDSCPGMAACPFVAKMPKTYSIPARKVD
ncbi:MAG: FeoC-like transcriptional regulator [Chloroflexota bacterium]|nr:FeoC-like transcriptional regulator [Chloroflexota bacterium]